MANIFITGGTGFLGSLLADIILSSTNDNVHFLARDKFAVLAKGRLISLLENLRGGEKLNEETKKRIKAYTGNIAEKNLGLEKKDSEELQSKIEVIFHSAAATDLNLPLIKARKLNTEGTRNLLDFAMLCGKKGALKKVNHISTAYIAGAKRCVFRETDLDIGQTFNNTYEESKFEAEKIVHEYREKGLDIDVFRPAIMLGRFKDGRTTSFKMFYQPLHFFSLELFDRIPAREDSMANMLNIDIAAEAIFKIFRFSERKNTCYHIVSPNPPTFEFILNTASDFFGFKKPEIINPEDMDMAAEYSMIKKRMLGPYLPYFNYLTEFTMENTKAILESGKFVFPELDKENLIRLFEYCEKINFIKRKKKCSYKVKSR